MLTTLYRRAVYANKSFATRKGLAVRTRADVGRHMADLLRNGGRRPLGARARARVQDYARCTLGSADFAPWLEFYTVYRGAFHEGWIPENFFQLVAIPAINGPYHKLCFARSLQRRLLGDPALPDLIHFVGGDWRDLEGEPVPRCEVKARLFADAGEICLKTDQSLLGRGVSFVCADDFDLAAVERLGDLVVQRAVRQHPALARFSPQAVATLRIATGRPAGGAPQLLGAYLRVGVGASRAVDAHSIEIAILDGCGTLDAAGVGDAWRMHDRHPDTGAAFAGAAAPGFPAMAAKCLDLHARRLPQFGYVGWDATLDADGAVRILEFNTGRPSHRFLEMSVGPCLRALDLERFVGWSRKDNWS
jgi:hypothetical protein